MARIIITADDGRFQTAAVLYQERVDSSLLESEHASSQLLERIAWAVGDAEQAEAEAQPAG